MRTNIFILTNIFLWTFFLTYSFCNLDMKLQMRALLAGQFSANFAPFHSPLFIRITSLCWTDERLILPAVVRNCSHIMSLLGNVKSSDKAQKANIKNFETGRVGSISAGGEQVRVRGQAADAGRWSETRKCPTCGPHQHFHPMPN